MIHIIEKLISESLLSLYPIFIKKIPINLDMQLLTRLLGYSLIPLFFVSFKFIKNNLLTGNVIMLALITIFHIFFSYSGFKILDAGVSYALFYTYPIMIIAWATKKFSPYYLTTILGILLLSIRDFKIDFDKIKGIMYIILAAVTEVMIFFNVQGLKTDNSWNTVFLSYFPALIMFGGYLLLNNMNNKNNKNNKNSQGKNNVNNENYLNNGESKIKNKYFIIGALLFNVFIGVIGYFLRFRVVKKLPTVLNGVLSFFGIITSYIYGIIFDGESVNLQEIVGITLIIFSNIKLITA